MTDKDFTYKYGYNGYKLFYKGQPIGGAGTILSNYAECKHRKNRKNKMFNKEMAEISIKDILSGRIRPDMKKAIEKIDGR